MPQPAIRIRDHFFSGEVTLKESYSHIISLVFWKRIVFRPTFLLKVRNDVLAGDQARLFSEDPDRLLDSRFVVTHSPVTHTIFRSTLKLIQPAMNLLKRLAKKPDRFLAMFLK
jgi:hypothetical protein